VKCLAVRGYGRIGFVFSHGFLNCGEAFEDDTRTEIKMQGPSLGQKKPRLKTGALTGLMKTKCAI
jgi:hypothetical protein